MISRDAILAEVLEIESLLEDDRLNDQDRFALYGAQQALRNILEPDTGTKPPRRSTASTTGRARPLPCFFTS